MKRWWLGWLIAWLSVVTLAAQDAAETPPQSADARVIERLQPLLSALEEAQGELQRLHARFAVAVTPEERAEIEAEVDQQRLRLSQLRENFRMLATGVEESEYRQEETAPTSLQKQLEDIIEPISRGMREMTSGPREMAKMRDDLQDWQARRDLGQSGLRRLDPLLENAAPGLLRDELEATRRLWTARLANAESRIQVLEQQIAERERADPGTWKRVSGVLADFWRSRGINLLLALATAVAAFVLSRRIYRAVRGISPLHRKGGNDFAARSADLLGAVLAVLLALMMVILVFYLRGDWLLLTLVILALVGVAWASKQALPPYIEQIRLILNIGPVRQGERLVYEGIPWQVEKLNFYCEFRNPELAGGLLRLPVRDVMPLHSRPLAEKEEWFPSRMDDWVKLADDTFGKVIQQTPDHVVILKLGGSLKSYPTAMFLAQTPENLSRGFRLSVKFGIDYQHQAICTTEVPALFQRALESRLTEVVGKEGLRSLKVEFASAGSSSLDYAILADFTGEVASRCKVLERLIQKTCVEICNGQEWVIPFTQITVHQAAKPQNH
jgi:small-conductance mechanosensitive channel